MPEMPDIKAGDGLELAHLMKVFATKNAPDNTIKRLYDLEQRMAELNGKVNNLDGLPDRMQSLESRVAKLETRADKSDTRLDTDEADIEELKKRMSALENMEMPTSTALEPGNLDTGAILK